MAKTKKRVTESKTKTSTTSTESKKTSAQERRTLILWALLVRENAAAFQKELKPEPEKADRDTLTGEGLIKWEKRGQRIWIEVTDEGWAWADKNLDAALPAKSNASGQILQAWLTRLKAFMGAKRLVLADVLGPQGPAQAGMARRGGAESLIAAPGYPALRERIRQAYLDSTCGRFNTRALLSDVREKLKDIDRATLDEALKRMQREQEASLYRLDNQAEITEADRAAAIYVGQEPRHLLWIEQ
jgi:hypothetical protein